MKKKNIIFAITSIGIVIAGGFYLKDASLFGAVGCNYQPIEKLTPLAGADKDGTTATLTADSALRNKANAVYSAIEAYQLNFIKTNEKYWQALKTHSQPVEYGTSVHPEYLDCLLPNGKPSWNGTGIVINPPLPFQVEIHEYETFKGDKGFQVFFFTQKDGLMYSKSIGYGVESAQRTWDWRWQRL